MAVVTGKGYRRSSYPMQATPLRRLLLLDNWCLTPLWIKSLQNMNVATKASILRISPLVPTSPLSLIRLRWSIANPVMLQSSRSSLTNHVRNKEGINRNPRESVKVEKQLSSTSLMPRRRQKKKVRVLKSHLSTATHSAILLPQ